MSHDQGLYTPNKFAVGHTTCAGGKDESSNGNDGVEAGQVDTPSGHKREV